MQNCSSNHTTCRKIREASGSTGVAVLPVNKYYNQTWVAYLIQENSSHNNYANLWNICSGKLEPQDGGCYLRAAVRELYEEMKLLVKFPVEFDRHFKDGEIQYIMHRKTPVFIGVFPSLSRVPLNILIKTDNSNPNLPATQRETQGVDIFRIPDGQSHDSTTQLTKSPFADAVIRKIQIQNLERQLANFQKN